MPRFAMGLRYDGSAFEGWQTQPHRNTVQDTVQAAIAKIAGHDVTVYCAGRTDTGVHARQQLVHFDTEAVRPVSAWVRGVNNFLPSSVAVTGVKPIDPAFHARFSAFARTYRYYFYSSPVEDPFRPFMTWVHYPLNLEAMRKASQCLIGTHDFSAFRASQCQAKSPVKTLDRVELVDLGESCYLEVHGNAFLHHMVRNMVGALMEVGLGRESEDWVQEVLASRDRSKAAKTWPARGLTLWEVHYPSHFEVSELFDVRFVEA
ncbi:tRNA pseudouridine(38-40) synthase TruA [Limnobacter sp.]|uniref:tRNA pseudouridine(38-40) synthase TruA n=1 Tax=Limnobacter sp. TaxID=2003368 RepID=UPI002583E14B|nr:tRNA pseudouridine(38-40) synthase TruA [Limnobacter sp.]HEX5486685.1 tRNA pseudouridine(38-40) synthase TruA [Limnobacter sp.]